MILDKLWIPVDREIFKKKSGEIYRRLKFSQGRALYFKTYCALLSFENCDKKGTHLCRQSCIVTKRSNLFLPVLLWFFHDMLPQNNRGFSCAVTQWSELVLKTCAHDVPEVRFQRRNILDFSEVGEGVYEKACHWCIWLCCMFLFGIGYEFDQSVKCCHDVLLTFITSVDPLR